MRVAVVWNEPSDLNATIPDIHRATITSLMRALQEGGHETFLCEGDKGLLTTLERFMPLDPQARPSGMVFNMAYGIKGEWRCSQVPTLLEMAGIPYTGPSPVAAALELDKVIAKKLVRDDGGPTPNFQVMRRGTESTGDLRFPLIVKPRYEAVSSGLQLVHEPTRLKQAVEEIVTHYGQDALVEEYIDGREICVALLGNEELEVLPLVEHEFGEREVRLITRDDKNHIGGAEPQKVCPAQVGCELTTMLRDISVAAFRTCLGRDYARVDFRIDRSGQPFFLEINFSPSLNGTHSYVRAATAAGYSFSKLANRILDLAYRRHFGIGIPGANSC
ncbi:D-alanine--D-alanine ligase family protein [Bradyrhizobium cajani]|uniref:ATP-grasp domain-containing protein n=1 Tax=Bradyrhizobium cajani TaxID=1928661 RepID=A0A844T7L2_9BRAD|nr:ATP-grasp domain-containing protein [Bradyrhizobium cajani]MCP3368609.1 ATP-grasp domain-containing protein [Bradyrhizobium cajani]MVT73595.1 ATP-grasp domain-containing protein [Bradyrhizobium cajani]